MGAIFLQIIIIFILYSHKKAMLATSEREFIVCQP